MQSSHSAAAEQWVNMWLAKQGVPKNIKDKKYINKNCFKKGSGWKGGKKTKKQTIYKRRKTCEKEKYNGLRTKKLSGNLYSIVF